MINMRDVNHRDRGLLDLARGQACQNCGTRDGTIVAAHSNAQQHGKGKSLKAHDCLHAWLCMACHDWLDGRRNGLDPTGMYQPVRFERREMWERAFARTVVELWRQGLIGVIPQQQRAA
jgi:Protein of unknown function (DUF1364)